jgi:hypothetical protein
MDRLVPWLLLGGLGGYVVLRRHAKRGGATDDEVNGSLPGDDVIPHPMIETTHAVTVQAPPSAVWPWLMQAGYRGAGRAGWYTDSWFDLIVEGGYLRLTTPANELIEHPGARSATEILPELQHLAVGDIVSDGPADSAYFVVKGVDPERSLVLYSDTHLKYVSPVFLRDSRWASSGEFTWVFELTPLKGERTRLVLRLRGNLRPARLREVFVPLFYLGEAVIPGQILRGLKWRAEALNRGERPAPARHGGANALHAGGLAVGPGFAVRLTPKPLSRIRTEMT